MSALQRAQAAAVVLLRRDGFETIAMRLNVVTRPQVILNTILGVMGDLGLNDDTESALGSLYDAATAATRDGAGAVSL